MIFEHTNNVTLENFKNSFDSLISDDFFSCHININYIQPKKTDPRIENFLSFSKVLDKLPIFLLSIFLGDIRKYPFWKLFFYIYSVYVSMWVNVFQCMYIFAFVCMSICVYVHVCCVYVCMLKEKGKWKGQTLGQKMK